MPMKLITDNPLDRWVEESDVRLIDLADAHGIASDMLTRWRRADYYPKREIALLIARITGGGVLPNDWVGADLNPAALRVTREWKRTLKAMGTSQSLAQEGRKNASRKTTKSAASGKTRQERAIAKRAQR